MLGLGLKVRSLGGLVVGDDGDLVLQLLDPPVEVLHVLFSWLQLNLEQPFLEVLLQLLALLLHLVHVVLQLVVRGQVLGDANIQFVHLAGHLLLVPDDGFLEFPHSALS